MAKRERARGPAAAPAAQDTAAPAAQGTAPQTQSSAASEHLVVFQLAEGSFGLRLGGVGEIIRLPGLAHMPLSPPSLMGLANLRGAVLPVVSLRRLLGLPEAPANEATRVIVLDSDTPVGFVVDQVDRLLTLPAARIEHDDAGAGALDPDMLDGAVKGAEGEGTTKILNPQRLLRDQFVRLGVSDTRPRAPATIAAATTVRSVTPAQRQELFVSFEVGRQEYALPLERVREIIPLPEQIAEMPRAETAVLGVVTLRDRLLPLVSLRALLGLECDEERRERGKVVVVSLGSGGVGIVVERTREILSIDPAVIDPAPALLTRGAGDAEITSICRLDGGRRLVALLSPDRLFRSDLVRRVLAEQGDANEIAESRVDDMADEQLIIFRLGDQEFGLPVGAVDEIARPPARVTPLPKAPAFIDGVMNLRGHVVPIVDLRRRFGLAAPEPGSQQRVLVLAMAGGKTGFLVDAVSEVLKVSAGAIAPAPQLSAEQVRLIGRVVNLEAQGRMILLIDATQLLDRVEADMLAKFDRAQLEPASQPS
jgi:purine-binding chemotaxis protein CheW